MINLLHYILYHHLNLYPSDITKFIDDLFPFKIFSASVQTSFRLEKPVSQLIPYIETLEHDMHDEIALPNTEVLVLPLLVFLYFFFSLRLFRHMAYKLFNLNRWLSCPCTKVFHLTVLTWCLVFSLIQ